MKFKNNKKIYLYGFLIFIGIFLLVFTEHDAFMYHEPIVRIERIDNGKKQTQQDQFQNKDYTVKQNIRGIVLNGKNRGKTVRLKNTYSESGAMDCRYTEHSQIFVSSFSRRDHHLTATIVGYKRDIVVILMAWLVVSIMIVLFNDIVVKTLFSLLINTCIFFGSIFIYLKWQDLNVFAVFSVVSILFAVLTLRIVLGWNQQMLVTLLSTLLGMSLTIGLSYLVFKFNKQWGIEYEALSYVTVPLQPLFLSETLIGALGAVMDDSTDIVSMLFALKQERPDVDRKTLFKSGINIGQSIMGPLINVLFLIFIASVLPLAIMFVKNGNTLGYTYTMTMSLGVIQSLISGIGIVVSIPIASWLTSLMIVKRR